MKLRAMVAAAVLAAAALAPTAARAEDKPSLVLRLKSIDGLIGDVKYIAKLAGQEEQAEQIDQVLKAFGGENGLGGIDTKRPIAAYGDISGDPQNSPVVILVPIADEKTFVEFLGNTLMIKAEKDKDGVYTAENIPNVPLPVYFRFANKYAYVTLQDKANIDLKKLPKPEAIVFKAGDTTAASLALRLDGIPDLLKQIALTQFENQLAAAKEQKVEGETAAAREFRLKAVDYFGGKVKAILTDGEELSVNVAVDPAKDDITLDLSFKAKSGSPLAKDMVTIGGAKSLFAGLGKGGALQLAVAAALPDDLKKMLGPVIDDAIKETVAKEKDEAKAKLAKQALEALAPTLKAGELDFGVALTGPDKDGMYTGVGGLKVKDGKRVEEAVRAAVAALPANEKDKVQLDAASVGGAKVHKILFDDKDQEAKKLFGSSGAYVAIGADTVLVALGPDAMKALEQAAALTPQSAPLLSATVSVARMAGLDVKDEKGIKAATAVWGKNPAGTDTVTATVEMGEAVRVKLTAKGKIIEFGAKMQKAGEEAPPKEEKKDKDK